MKAENKMAKEILEKKVNTILEGSFHDEVNRLQYSELELEIPSNAKSIMIGKIQFLLYGAAKDFNRLKPEALPKANGKGWPLKKLDGLIDWVFESPRSLITEDGRIYVSSTYFEKGWGWYLDKIPIILNDCKKQYSKYKSK